MASGEICTKMSEQVGCSQPNSTESLQQQQLQSNQDILPYKNRLQEYTQRSKIRFPIYQTVNEGEIHAPKFRATVVVDGNTYISSNTFSIRRAAEQDVAKVALEGISKKINNWVSNKMSDEGFPPINEVQEKAFCKSILYEFAAKMNLERPIYETASFQGGLPGFVSSVVFGGVKYTGEACKSKKEAEQNAAREAIVTILGNLGLGTILPEIIKAKAKCFTYKERRSDVGVGVSPVGIDSGNGTGASAIREGVTEDGNANKVDNLILNAAQEATGDRDANKAGNLTENAAPNAHEEQISDVQPLEVQPNLDILNCNQKRKSKNKKKANKKLKPELVADLNNVQAVSEGAT